MKKISLSTLKRFDGDNEIDIFIAHNGIVYDVSNCPKWRTGLHEGIHFGGQDLTNEFHKAPHQDEVFKHPCIKIIGILEETR